MATATYCSNFYSKIFDLFNDGQLKVQLVKAGASVSSTTDSITDISAYLVTGSDKEILATQDPENAGVLIADNAVWTEVETASFSDEVRYAVIYTVIDSKIIFFIDFNSDKNIQNNNFEINWETGVIKLTPA